MPIGVSASIEKARVATPTTAIVAENANVQIIRAKDITIQEPFVATKSTILQVIRNATFSQSARALKLINKLEFDLTVLLSPSVISGRITFVLLTTRQNIGHGLRQLIFNATQSFAASLSSTKIKVTTLSTTQPTSVSTIKLRIRTLTSGFSTALPPTFYSIFITAKLTSLKLKTKEFIISETLAVTRSSKINITKNLAHVMLIAIRKEVPLFTETLTSSNAIHVIKSVTPNKILRSTVNQISRFSHNFSITQSPTVTTEMTVQSASRKRFSTISTGLIPNFVARKIAVLSVIATSIGTVSNISRQVSLDLTYITQLNIIAQLRNFVFKTMPTAVVTTNSTISNRLIKFMVTTQQHILASLPKLVVKQPFRVTSKFVVKLGRIISIGRTVVVSVTTRIQVGKTWLIVLAANFSQSATFLQTRHYSVIATQSTVALLNKTGRKIVKTTEHVIPSIISIPNRIIGVPGTVVLRNIESAYIKLRNIFPYITLRSWFK